jgi:tetratricopeptide (TPR) repeat protein
VAYESLLSDQRTALHRAAVSALEAHTAVLPEAQVERLAHHALCGEVWGKAAEYCGKAAGKAYEHSALNDAIRLLEQALSALDRVPPTAKIVGQSIDLRVQLRQALWSVGRVTEANAHLIEAERLAETLDDKTRIAAIGVIKTQIFNSEGDLDRAVATGQRARSVAQMVGSEPLAISAEFFLSQSYFFRGELRQAIAVLEPLRARITGELRRERLGTSMTTSVLCLVNQARAYALLGDFPQARALAAEAEAIAREVGRPFDLGFALHALGNIAVVVGDYKEALVTLEQALELCRAYQFDPLFPLVACPLGFALACLGDATRGRELLANGTLIAQRSRLIFYVVWSAAFGARAHLETEALDTALGIANDALPKAINMNFRFLEVWLRRVAGVAVTDPNTALTHLHSAAALATELDTRPDLAHCRWALADAYERLGRYEESQAERTAANELYRALDIRRSGIYAAVSRTGDGRAS